MKREGVMRVGRPDRGDAANLCGVGAELRQMFVALLLAARAICRLPDKASATRSSFRPRLPSSLALLSRLTRRLDAVKTAAKHKHQLINCAWGFHTQSPPRSRKLLAAVALLLASSPGYASGWTGDLVITSAFTEANTDIIAIYTSDGQVYAPGCTANAWVFPASSAARASRGYATLLTAIATGKKVNFWFADSCGVWGFHQVTSIRIVN